MYPMLHDFYLSRIVKEKDYSRFILLTFGKGIRKLRPVCSVMNRMLPVSAVVAFFLSICGLVINGEVLEFCDYNDFHFPAYMIIFCFSIFLHEVGHTISCIAYSYRLTDAGILLVKSLPIGFYVAYEPKRSRVKKEEVQLSLAGIEVNLLLASLCILAGSVWPEQSFTLFMAAYSNLLLMIANLMPTEKTVVDGEAALCALFEIKSAIKLSQKWLRSDRRRRKLLRSGMPGIACILIFKAIRFSNRYYLVLNVILSLSPMLILLWKT